MSILDRFRLEIKAPAPAPSAAGRLIEWLGSDVPSEAEARFATGDATEEQIQRQALTLPAIFTSANNIAKVAAAHVPGVVRQAGPDQEAEAIKGHEFERVLWEPNPWMSTTFLFWFTFFALPVRGSAFWYLADDREGGPIQEIWPMPPHRVTPVATSDTSVFISHYNYRVDRQAEPVKLPPRNVLWVRQPNIFDLFDGLSSIAPLADNVETARNQRTYRKNFFGPMHARPSTAIGVKKELSKPAFEAIKEEILHELHVLNRATMVHRGGDIDVKTFGMTVEELGLLELDEADARIFKEVLGWSEALGARETTYASAYAAQDLVTEYSVWPYLQLLAGDITAQILKPRYGPEFRCRYTDIRPARREADRDDYEVYGRDRTVNENRARRGEQPITEGPVAEICDSVPVRLLPLVLGRGAAGGGDGIVLLNDELKSDLDKWERKALRLFGENGHMADFRSDAIPPEVHADVVTGLAMAGSPADVKAVFKAAREVAAGPFFHQTGDGAAGGSGTRRWEHYP